MRVKKRNRMRKTYCNRVLSSYFFAPPPSRSYPARSPFVSSRLVSSVRSPLRSFTVRRFGLFRARTLCYPASINGAERTIQQRTMQSMNDGIVRDVQWP